LLGSEKTTKPKWAFWVWRERRIGWPGLEIVFTSLESKFIDFSEVGSLIKLKSVPGKGCQLSWPSVWVGTLVPLKKKKAEKCG
jgi:hypothetical protein